MEWDHKLGQNGCECGCPHIPMFEKNRATALHEISEAVKAAKEVKRMLLEHGYHAQSAVMYELDKITIFRMDACIQQDPPAPKWFRKRPAMVDAQQITKDNICQLARWCGGTAVGPSSGEREFPEFINIPTLEGYIPAQIGDWIIKGVAGEFHPCKPDIFAKTYDLAE